MDVLMRVITIQIEMESLSPSRERSSFFALDRFISSVQTTITDAGFKARIVKSIDEPKDNRQNY